MLYKSKYNIIYRIDEKCILIFNTLKRTVTKVIDTSGSLIINEFIINPENKKFCENYNNLINKGILVYDTEEETREAVESYEHKTHVNNLLSLTIFLGERCNFRCRYCWQKHEDDKDLSNEDLDKLVMYINKNIQGKKCLNISWFGGEPLLYLDKIKYYSIKYIQIAKEYKVPYTAEITTNGYLLNKETIEDLIRLKVYTYQITIDGNKFTHDLQRKHHDGNGTFLKILHNITEISKGIRKTYLVFYLRMNITKNIIAHQDVILRDLEKIKLDKRFIFRIVPCVEEEPITSDEYIEFCLKMKQMNFRIIFSFSDIKIEYFCSYIYDNVYNIMKGGEIKKCVGKRSVGYINEGGEANLNRIEKWNEIKVKEKCLECKAFPICYNMICPIEREKCHSEILFNNKFGLLLNDYDTIEL